jgi:hypothetical protein
MKSRIKLAAIRHHSPAILFLVQIVIALLFAIPAAEQAAYSAEQATSVTITTDQTARLGKIYFGTPTTDAAVGAKQSLPILVDTGGANINSLAFTITVPPDAVRLESLDLKLSFCTITTQQNLSAATGQLQFACGTPNPGLRSQIGSVGVLEYTPLRSGAAVFHIDPTSASLLANDGHGSEVLRNVEDKSVVVSGGSTTTTATLHIPLVSASHPTSTVCSREETATFSWLRPSQTDHFEYELNTSPQDITSPKSTTDTEMSLATAPGTTQYFHLRAVIAGTTTPISTLVISSCSTSAEVAAPAPTAQSPITTFFHNAWSSISSLWKR